MFELLMLSGVACIVSSSIGMVKLVRKRNKISVKLLENKYLLLNSGKESEEV